MYITKAIKVDKNCTGCNFCLYICPKNAISNEVDQDGFWKPCIDEGLCVNCGRCVAMCPVINGKKNYQFDKPVVFAMWNQNVMVRQNSSSGGIFSLIADLIISNGGSVFGAAYDDDFSIHHIRVDKKEELPYLRGSKYVQSSISNSLYEAMYSDLKSGRSVMFTGTPCQVAAVNQFVKSDSFTEQEKSSLLTVDVICHGVPSPKAWQSYLNEIRSCGKEIMKINMRDKTHGWDKFELCIDFSDGSSQSKWFNIDSWGKSFINNIFLRSSCYDCQFKGEIRNADITLGDFWGAARGKYRKYDDNDRGTSVVLINSEKGKNVITELTNCFKEEISYEFLLEHLYALFRSSTCHSKRDKAFRMLETDEFSTIVNRMTKKPIILKGKTVFNRIIKNLRGDD